VLYTIGAHHRGITFGRTVLEYRAAYTIVFCSVLGPADCAALFAYKSPALPRLGS